jgi:hypothetical protein
MNEQIKSRLASLKLCAGCLAILAVLAFTQHQDEADDAILRAQIAAKGERPVEWIDLEKIADSMPLVGR